MSLHTALRERSGGTCELCNEQPASVEFTVTPKEDTPENQVALCPSCNEIIGRESPNAEHWHCLEGSIWNPEPAVQALSYRILYGIREHEWASQVIHSVELDEEVVRWAMSAYDVAPVHRDAFGNVLENGDTVVLTENLNVKGTNFTAAKGTVVKRIRLVPDNTEQIEGKVNEQLIVILTKFVKKN